MLNISFPYETLFTCKQPLFNKPCPVDVSFFFGRFDGQRDFGPGPQGFACFLPKLMSQRDQKLVLDQEKAPPLSLGIYPFILFLASLPSFFPSPLPQNWMARCICDRVYLSFIQLRCSPDSAEAEQKTCLRSCILLIVRYHCSFRSGSPFKYFTIIDSSMYSFFFLFLFLFNFRPKHPMPF